MKPRSLRRVVATYLAAASLVIGGSAAWLFMQRGQAVFFQNFQSLQSPYAGNLWVHSVVPVNAGYMAAAFLTLVVTAVVAGAILRTVTKGHDWSRVSQTRSRNYGHDSSLKEDRNREEVID